MPDFPALLQQGTANAWLFIPSAILLGALHGLEPGHSKTMMAAFIIAVRGTLTQAILLGLAATVSHTLIVWIIALSGMYFGQQWNVEANEPYLQLVSATIIICIAFWMIWRTWQMQHTPHTHTHHEPLPDDGVKQIDTGHGIIQIDIFEENTPPRFRLLSVDQRIPLIATDVTIDIERDISNLIKQSLNRINLWPLYT
jgi:nickel/cobalt exporter